VKGIITITDTLRGIAYVRGIVKTVIVGHRVDPYPIRNGTSEYGH